MGSARNFLREGNYEEAGRVFQRELDGHRADTFSIALARNCRLENVARLVDAAGGGGELMVLPYRGIDERRCYGVVWGLYGSRQEAQEAVKTLPESLRLPDAQPISLASILR